MATAERSRPTSNERRNERDETPRKEKLRPEASSLMEMANSDNSLEGYAAINGLSEQEEIARLAYQLYEERGGQHGSHEEDWYRAERIVRARQGQLEADQFPT